MTTEVAVVSAIAVAGAGRRRGAPRRRRRRRAAQAPPAASQTAQSRYQIGMMERVLEGAVEHGASITRDRVQALVPATDAAQRQRARARLPPRRLRRLLRRAGAVVRRATLPWSLRTLDQNDLGLESALKALQTHVDAAGDTNLEQALKRVELQVGPLAAARRGADAGRRAQRHRLAGRGAPPAPRGTGAAPAAHDPILDDPDEAYRTEVKQALMDAMLDHSGPLAIGPTTSG